MEFLPDWPWYARFLLVAAAASSIYSAFALERLERKINRILLIVGDLPCRKSLDD